MQNNDLNELFRLVEEKLIPNFEAILLKQPELLIKAKALVEKLQKCEEKKDIFLKVFIPKTNLPFDMPNTNGTTLRELFQNHKEDAIATYIKDLHGVERSEFLMTMKQSQDFMQILQDVAQKEMEFFDAKMLVYSTFVSLTKFVECFHEFSNQQMENDQQK